MRASTGFPVDDVAFTHGNIFLGGGIATLVAVPGSLRQITYPLRDRKLPHWGLRFGFQSRSSETVTPLALAKESQVSHEETVYVSQL